MKAEDRMAMVLANLRLDPTLVSKSVTKLMKEIRKKAKE